ncbi:Hsp33 family molecular chaperone HslO [Atopomonas sediminilitoris]|uniref:Hsp33 family molecular chaperone HslO n=1 Tax=Atopomonas sediminilitoris TaxID=2919919 RepID=UPI001F4D7CB5|nr:Hsp33 family molecular chaperone HslO [Atopomonas sediminilitoris]MCJ8169390.1 Hsp33 family molecular chaperone HslO [Atopomonas sediminilitoris]
MPDTDHIQRFMFDTNDVRGELAALEHSYHEVLARTDYPVVVQQLLGELLAAASLLSSTLKFEGVLVLQARSEGPLKLLMIECTDQQLVRGIARFDDTVGDSADLRELMPDGVMAITIDPIKGQRYQGIVPLEDASLAASLSSYFASSEQLPTQFWLYADGRRARGLLLQALPKHKQLDSEERANTWEHLVTLADTLNAEEMLGLDNQTLLHRLYHQEEVRLFEPQPVQFSCSCSRERSANALVSLGEHDALQLADEQDGAVTIDCQFCNQRYSFDRADIGQLFNGGGVVAPSGTQH